MWLQRGIGREGETGRAARPWHGVSTLAASIVASVRLGSFPDLPSVPRDPSCNFTRFPRVERVELPA